jgi:heme exporter protein A
MQQRLSLARAVLHEPQLLLFDEPFTGLDEPACELLADLLREFVGSGGAALVTTHDIDRGLSVADRIAVLETGRVVHEADASTTGVDAFRATYRELLRSEAV